MGKRKESIAEIVAEMRMGSPVNPGAYKIGLPDKITVLESGNKMRTIQIKTVTVKELADRIEAAAKHHRPGNAAAMREALKPWIAFAEWLLENAGKDKLGEACREYGPIIRQRMEELSAAISAPARNCDRFRTAEEADKAFNEFCAAERTGKCKPAECSLPSGTGAKSCQLAWLFATAAEGSAE